MPDALKNIYNDKFFAEFSTAVQAALPGIDKKRFLAECRNEDWDQLELKQRMRHLAACLHAFLEGNYQARLKQVLRIVNALPASSSNQYGSLAYMLFPDFVEQYGLDDPIASLAAMEKLTVFASCEFAIRPFLISYPDLVMDQMIAWSKHSDYRVRRFASEGCRPRLPWAMAIPSLKKDPAPIRPVLENLKNDPSEFVRRSVANNLNDIAKDHPGWVLNICKKWQGKSRETDAIIKHGCRTLLKHGNAEALNLFGTGGDVKGKIKSFRLMPSHLKIGEVLHFSFQFVLHEKVATKLRLEYVVSYMKARDKLSNKIFKITETTAPPGATLTFARKLSLKNLTTRTHYPGEHKIAIMVNGKEFERKNFTLSAK